MEMQRLAKITEHLEFIRLTCKQVLHKTDELEVEIKELMDAAKEKANTEQPR